MAFEKGKRTVKKLAQADYKLTLLVDEVLKNMDIGVFESSRTLKRQQKLFRKGLSQLDGIKRVSKHQVDEKHPKARAIDCFPYEKGHNSFDGSDKSQLMFYEMNWHFYRASVKLNIPIKQGYLWSFKDMPHIELAAE
jgi:peptidoglycan L-alanyl-D-glutamate endopeptidase CwlK